MNRPSRPFWPRSERGIAAVEFAVLLPVMLAFFAFSLFFGRVFWHYTAAQKAAHDAARYLSSVPTMQINTPGRTTNVVQVAQAIAQAETEGLNPGPYPPVISVLCDGLICDGFSVPTTITVGVRVAMFDDSLYWLTSDVIGASPLPLTATVTMRYVGR
jgi:hypothetical protein